MKKRPLVIGILIALVLLSASAVVILSRNNMTTQIVDAPANIEESKLPVLEIFNGEVEVKFSEGEFVPGEDGQVVKVGSVVKTKGDSRAQIVYPNNSVTRLDQNSEATLTLFEKSPSKIKVTVESGRIWNRVAKLLGKEEVFESESETLIASVRGTSYGHGILLDGSNKITVNKSEVIIDCIPTDFVAEVVANKKVTTKCDKALSILNWGGDEANDEWFQWNIDQDKQLDERFGGETYGDQATPTPSPTIVPKKTASPTPVPTAASTQTPLPTQNPTLSPTPTPTPPPDFTVERASCTDYCYYQQDVYVDVYGKGFDANVPSGQLKVYVVNQQGQKFYAEGAAVESSNTISAHYNAISLGTYYVGVEQYGKTVQNTNATFTITTIY